MKRHIHPLLPASVPRSHSLSIPLSPFLFCAPALCSVLFGTQPFQRQWVVMVLMVVMCVWMQE